MPVISGILASSKSGHLSTNNFFQIQQLSPSAVYTITFSSIPSTYKSLQVRFNLVALTINSGFYIQFNGDTGTNYAYHELGGNGSTTTASGQITQNSGVLLNDFTNGTITTYPNVGIVDIIDYANANKNKTTKSFAGANNNTTGSSVNVSSGLWLSTAAITSLTFKSGTSFTGTVTLYGVN